jgi:Cu+-exporting ATPase
MRTVMISGDNRGAAEAMARAWAWTREVMAEVLPGDKAAQVVALQQGEAGATVAMVGDGVNDARRWRRPTWAWPWAPAPTWPCTRPASR